MWPSMFTARRAQALGAAMVLAWAAQALAQESVEPPHHQKLDRSVHEALLAGRPAPVIVQFTDVTSRVRGQQAVLEHGGIVSRAFGSGAGFSASVDAATIDALAFDPGVARISIDAVVRPTQVSLGGSIAAVTSSGAAAARHASGRRGEGIAVAVIDSGVQPHPDLPASRIRAFVDFVDGRSEPYDDFGHGTHVAGIVAGSGATSAGFAQPVIGTAPEVDVVALKVLDRSGAGRTSDVVAALEWVLANFRNYNIRVVNLSLGHPVFEPAATDPMVRAAEALTRRGIVVIASAGNQGIDPKTGAVGYGGITSPANGPSIIAVGAVDDKGTETRRDDTVTDYSGRGPTRFDLRAKPDLVASGHRVVSLSAPGSTLFTNYPQLQVYGGAEAVPAYFRLSGTSMAAPVVAGAAALVLDANPRLSASTVKMLLEFTAERLSNADRLTQGAGYVNTLGAVRLATLVNPRVPRGMFWLRQPAMPVAGDTLFGEHVAWAKNVVWGNRVLAGDAAYLHLAAWDDNVVWGNDLDNVVWGNADNVVWGNADNVVWGNNGVWGFGDGLLDNVVWGNDNIVWGNDAIVRSYWAASVVWSFWDDNVVWGNITRQSVDNVVWGNAGLDNVVWGNADNVVWGNTLAILTGGGL